MAFLDRFRRRRFDESDFEEEIRSHLAMDARERVDEGADEESARLASRKDFGNVTLATEAARRVWRPRWVEAVSDVAADAHYAGRVLWKSPGYALIVVVVLAVGIGLNAAVFSVFKALALAPLSGVERSRELAVVLATTGAGGQEALSYPDYRYLRDHDRAFDGLAGASLSAFSLGLGPPAERVSGEFVTGNYFPLLGVPAGLGRTVLPSDEGGPGQDPLVVLSHGLWRRAFGGAPDVIGRTIHLNGHPLTVVGVAAAAFHGSVVGVDVEVFVPITMADVIDGGRLDDRTASMMMVFGRLRPDMTRAQASEQVARLWSARASETTPSEARRQWTVRPIWQSPFGAQTYMLPAILVLGVMAGLLLLIVCANLSGLVLVRSVSRRAELGVRLALGASRIRILRLLLTENLLLALPGAALGLLLGSISLPLLWSAADSNAPVRMFLNVSVDGIVVGFVVMVSCASALAFGFIPALSSTRLDLVSVMKDDLPRGSTRGRLRATLVVSQGRSRSCCSSAPGSSRTVWTPHGRRTPASRPRTGFRSAWI